MSKKISHIGNLMKILDISLLDVSIYLCIDKTTVSKWKTGSRKLSERSPYYEKLLEYFIIKNEEHSQKPLFYFFKSIYPDLNDKEQNFISIYIKRYLESKDVPINASNYIDGQRKALYQTSVSIFQGAAGRKDAMYMMLDIAEASGEICTIKILQLERFDWFVRDMTFVQNFVTRLENLIKKDHKVEFCHSTLNNEMQLRFFSKVLCKLVFYKNFKLSIINTQSYSDSTLCLYAIPNKFAAIGLNVDGKLVNIYTSVFLDTFSVEQYISGYESLLHKFSEQTNITDSITKKESIFSKTKNCNTNDEPVYCIGRLLSITTATEQLVLEILEYNNLTQFEKNKCLEFYHTFKGIMNAAKNSIFAGYGLALNTLKEAISCDLLIQYELSAIVKKQIQITGKQFRRHLFEMHNELLNNPNTKAILFPNIDIPESVSFIWAKKNAWGLFFNCKISSKENDIYYISDLSTIRRTVNEFIEYVGKFPKEFTNKEYIANVLEKLSRYENI